MARADEPRYTLDEARREITRQECARFGHSWDVIETRGGTPLKIICQRCGKSHNVVTTP